jgi:glycosyltransferase involved in cell wall biosynthesis
MRSDIKFTIFTGFYNYLDNLERLYEAIANQTYSNWEWLVCDDFSDDPEVLESLKKLEERDKRVRVIYPKYKKHYYWNLPISESSGEFILVQDSDDLMYPKLLECYLYHFEKFPELCIIGTASVLRGGSSIGDSIGAKYVKYGKSSNFIEALENNVPSVSGDARCFRKSLILNRGEIARPGEYRYGIIDDVLKMVSYEECGKFLCLPRTLHDYTFREGSVSGPMWQSRGISLEDISVEAKEVNEKAKTRMDRETLDSILIHYDDSFDVLYQMFYSDLGKIRYRARVEYYNNELTARNKSRINQLYFDHDFWFNRTVDYPSHLIFSIKDLNDIRVFSDRVSKIEPSVEQIVITLEEEAKDLRNEMEAAFYEAGIGAWYFIAFYDLFTYRINAKEI